MTLAPRPASASRCEMTELVLPGITNSLGNLMGGHLLHMMDICAAISAQRHSGHVCVTASVDNVDFHAPIKAGDVVVMESQVNRSFRTSLEVEIHVWAENPRTGKRIKSNRAFYTFVALGPDGPLPVVPVLPETDEEHERFEGAARRRELRLVMAGRLALDDATHLMALLRERLPAAVAPASEDEA